MFRNTYKVLWIFSDILQGLDNEICIHKCPCFTALKIIKTNTFRIFFPPPQTDLGVSRPDMNLFLWQVTFVWSIRRTQIDAHILWDMKVRPALVIIHVFNCGREQKKQTKCDVKESCSIWIYAGQRNYLTY